MKRFFQGRRKARAARVLIGVMALFFLLQTQPLFCDCPAEGAHTSAMASSTQNSHNGMPMEGCPCKDKGHTPKTGEDGPCPLCHCLHSCTPEEETAGTLNSTAPRMPGTILLAAAPFSVDSSATLRTLLPEGVNPAGRAGPTISLLTSSFRC